MSMARGRKDLWPAASHGLAQASCIMAAGLLLTLQRSQMGSVSSMVAQHMPQASTSLSTVT